MSAENFATCLRWTLGYEGGYSNHPDDPGKATMRGITQAVYDDDRRERNLPPRDVRGITDAELQAIYRRRYWQLAGCDALPAGVDYAVFDFAVNSGVARAVRTLQGIVGARPDGAFGSATQLAAMRYVLAQDAPTLSDSLCGARARWLRTLPTFGTFGAGWMRRVMGAVMGAQPGDTGVIDRALSLAMGGKPSEPLAQVATVKTYAAAGVTA